MENKKTAIVTGGTRGIGLGIVKQLIGEGYIVYAIGTRENYSDYEEFCLLKEQNESVRYICGNIAIEKDRQKIIDIVIRENNHIDLLVNNAELRLNKETIS